MMRDIWLGLLEHLAPPVCSGCAGDVPEAGQPFCGACEPLLDRLPHLPSDSQRALYTYGGPLAEAIARLKYRREPEVARALARLLVACVEPWRGRVDRVCVVPLSRRRLIERGYNQSALLARPVARALGVRFDPWLLRRVRETRSQVGAGPEERRSQLRGSFAAGKRACGQRVLVVDDVRTTGATLEEARRALLAAGATCVLELTLAGRAPDGGAG
jgi:ComF family protein